MPEKRRPKPRHSPDDGRPLPHMTYTWWICQKIIAVMTRKNQWRVTPPKTKPKRRRQRRRSKSRRSIDSNTGTGDDNTPDGAKDTEEPDEQAAEQHNREDGQVSPDEQAIEEDSEDGSYHPLSEEEVSLGNEDFIVPEEPLEQERFKLQLIATARSLKKKQQQLQADQDLLNDRWTDVLAVEEYGLKCPAKSCPKRRLLPQFDDEATTRSG